MIRNAMVFILAGVAAIGCDRPSPGQAKAPASKIEILASAYPLAEMAQRVGGASVDAQWLAEGSQRPEEVQATTELQQHANRAAIVITSGPWDGWATRLLSAEARNQRLIEPERMASAGQAEAGAYAWLDPMVAREVLEAARLRLTVVDPAHEAQYRSNAAAYAAELDAVAREWEAVRGRARGKTLLAVRPVWGALAKRYGVTVVAPVSGATEAQLSAADFKTLARYARDHGGARTILVDVGTPAAVRQQIEEKTGLRAVTMDALGTSASDGRNTLAKLLRYDLEQILKAIGE
jgi:ABC-type Zn uptake system ZnuABC Zn-binding protein ZnuA